LKKKGKEKMNILYGNLRELDKYFEKLVVNTWAEEYDNFCKTEISRIILEDAKRETSPLHEYFMWDDKVAADRYRLEQAERIWLDAHDSSVSYA
jgi:hypothetical protein